MDHSQTRLEVTSEIERDQAQLPLAAMYPYHLGSPTPQRRVAREGAVEPLIGFAQFYERHWWLLSGVYALQRSSGEIRAMHCGSTLRGVECGCVAANRWRACSMYFGSRSMPTKRRPSASAATPVAPLPMKQSRTSAPGRVDERTICRMRSSGFSHGCLPGRYGTVAKSHTSVYGTSDVTENGRRSSS